MKSSDCSHLFDIQVNGFAGVDFQQMDLPAGQLRHAVEALHKCNTPRIFFTLTTDSLENLSAKFRRAEELRGGDPLIAATVCGYHLEGPYLSPVEGYRGAHRAEYMRPPVWEEFQILQDAAKGNIRLVTIAPEWEGSAAFIQQAVKTGVDVSLGHTNASSDDISRAIDAGARFCTHVGNGVPQQLHRHDNVIHRLLARDELIAFFIPDGIHLPPFTLKNLFRAKPQGKAFFTTDAMAAAGAPPGRYRLGNVEVEVGADRVVREPGQPNFAGSALAPDEAVANIERFLDLPSEQARGLIGNKVADLFDL
jgi:N-acetylglucosamine-6-phosphate deacetylase